MKRRNNIAVELTPLLDVILIMLFLVMSQQKAESDRVMSEAQAAAAEYESRIEQLTDEYGEAKEKQLSAENAAAGYKSFDEFSVIIRLSIERSSDGMRKLFVSENGGTEVIEYGWDSLRYGENSLEAKLSECISENSGRPVFISFGYNEDEIYLRDYTLVTDVLERLDGEDIYISYDKESEEENNE